MSVVEEGSVDALHAADHCGVAVFLRAIKIFCLAGDFVCVGKHLVDTAVLCVQNVLHGGSGIFRNKINGPVAYLYEHWLCHCCRLVITIQVCIAKSCHHLVLNVKRYIASGVVELCGITCKHVCPQRIVGIAADISIQAGSVRVKLVLTVFHYFEHIVHALFQQGLCVCLVACSVCQCQGREIMASHVAVETEGARSPVIKVWVQGRPVGVIAGIEAGLPHKRSEEPVNIVGKEGLEIQVLSLFQRTVCHCYLAEVEMLRVNLTLCLCFLRERKGQAACSNDSSSFHVKQWLIFNC